MANEIIQDEDQIVVIESLDEATVLGPCAPEGPPAYEHTQTVASDEWIVEHNLGFKPNVTVVDSAGTVVFGPIEYVNQNILILRFTGPFGGKAYCS